MQHLSAICKEGRTAFARVQPPAVDLRQQLHQFGRRPPLDVGGSLGSRDQIAIREMPKRDLFHLFGIARRFSAPQNRPSSEIPGRNAKDDSRVPFMTTDASW